MKEDFLEHLKTNEPELEESFKKSYKNNLINETKKAYILEIIDEESIKDDEIENKKLNESALLKDNLMLKYFNELKSIQFENYAADDFVIQDIEDGYIMINNKQFDVNSFNQKTENNKETSLNKEITEEERKLFVKKVQSERKNIEKKRNIRSEEILNKSKEKEIENERKIIEKMFKEKEERKKFAEKKLEEQHLKRLKMKEENIEADKRLILALNRKKKIFEFSEMETPKTIKKVLDMTDINIHEKKYLEEKSKSKTKQIIIPGYTPSYRSQRILKAIEEEKLLEKKEAEEKKKFFEDKKYKKKEYEKYIKEKIPIHIDIKKKNEIEELIAAKEKKDFIDKKEIGNNYLKEARNRIEKKRNEKVKEQISSDFVEEPEKTTNNYSKMTLKESKNTFIKNEKYRSKSSIGYFNEEKEQLIIKKIDRLIHTNNLTKQEKLIQLRRQADFFNEEINKMETRKINDVTILLASVKTKMGILSLYNEKN